MGHSRRLSLVKVLVFVFVFALFFFLFFAALRLSHGQKVLLGVCRLYTRLQHRKPHNHKNLRYSLGLRAPSWSRMGILSMEVELIR